MGLVVVPEHAAPPDQPADKLIRRHAARHVAVADLSVTAESDQPAHVRAARHIDVEQSEVADDTVADRSEQPCGIESAAIDRLDQQVADGMPVAVESRTERIEGITNGHPAVPVVPIGVACVGAPAGVGVEVQIRRQFVADTSVGAPHPRRSLDERRMVPAPVGLHVRRAIAVQVVAHGVELRQIANIDETVVVRVVVASARRRPRLRWSARRSSPRDRSRPPSPPRCRERALSA